MRGTRALLIGLTAWVLVASSGVQASRMPPRYAWLMRYERRVARQAAMAAAVAKAHQAVADRIAARQALLASRIASQVEAPAAVPVPAVTAPSTPVISSTPAPAPAPAPPAPAPAPTTVGTPAPTAPNSGGNAAPAAPEAVSVPTPPDVAPPARIPTSAQTSWTLAATPAPAATPSVDAFLNLGSGPYPQENALTTGGAQPWYDSSAVKALFGGPPTDAQKADFSSTVLQRVEKTFQLAGVPVTLTTDPNTSAAHTLSVVSNTVSSWGPVLGLTILGDSGFSFIDQDAKNAQSVDQLEWIVAHNVAHELMLAFGVPEVHDQSGHYIDSTVGDLAMFLDPNATFSPSAAQDLLSRNFLTNSQQGTFAAQDAQAVPEPATFLQWTVVAGAVVAVQRRRTRSQPRTAR